MTGLELFNFFFKFQKLLFIFGLIKNPVLYMKESPSQVYYLPPDICALQVLKKN
ncbi:hypothetical protein SAMN04487894_101585 [Niabella drilacis]|uniref:Uncharacterized protein n=1 Tax=Niabella drilacis (strain DSM 25811 / CCM 8410 / CCUG 62505 / LMG 26954 / E90) TaxID=1285928 RepID=A0A1G6JMW5_NIADE|nr:hypothetical protein SAMN04487894_101585 [Niabella drilacis]